MREYIVIAEKQAHKIKKDIPWTTAVLAEPYTIAGNVTTRTNISAGDIARYIDYSSVSKDECFKLTHDEYESGNIDRVVKYIEEN